MRRAVVTGVGVVSPFGVGAAAFFDALAQGRSAVGPIRAFDATTFPTQVAGEVPLSTAAAADRVYALRDRGYDGGGIEAIAVSGALRDRKVSFGLLAAHEAWTQARCGAPERGAPLVIALGLQQAFLEDLVAILQGDGLDWSQSAAARAGLPHVRFRSSVDECAQAIFHTFALTGTCAVHTSACAAGTLAVTHAASLIERGAADVVLCGGTDSMVNPLGLGGFARLGAPSPRNAPDACRPFDRRRDGLAIGEGAAMFVLEEESRARARGATPVARILGWGSTQDAYRATAPRPDGACAARAMRRALERADLEPPAIGYINAHGTGTPLNDPAECRAIHAALGPHGARVPVSSIKGAVGHLMAASGAVEIAACVFALTRGVLPSTAHHREPDPECDVDVIGESPRPADVEAALSSSFGFGGQNASVVLGRCD